MLGAYLAETLASSGCPVRALVRDANAAAWLRPLGAELVAGNVRDAAVVREATAGCDVVFHTAAMVGPGLNYAPFREANVDGTQHVIDACAASGARLLHVSSTAVYGASRYENGAGGRVHTLPRAAGARRVRTVQAGVRATRVRRAPARRGAVRGRASAANVRRTRPAFRAACRRRVVAGRVPADRRRDHDVAAGPRAERRQWRDPRRYCVRRAGPGVQPDGRLLGHRGRPGALGIRWTRAPGVRAAHSAGRRPSTVRCARGRAPPVG